MSRLIIKPVLIFAITLLAGRIAAGQMMVIEVSRPYRSQSLAAIVTDPNGAPMPGVYVTLLGSGWKGEKATTRTNENGYFTFRTNSRGIYFLSLTAQGFQVHHYKIRVTRRVRFWPKLMMEVGT